MPQHALDAANQSVSFALCAVVWAVQLVIYPAFASIEPTRFCAWHAGYTRAITFVVAPLMFAQAAVVAWLLWLEGFGNAALVVEAACAAAGWLVTFFVSVPLHDALRLTRDEAPMRRLVRTNWLRTIAWSVAAVCAFLA